MSGGAPGSVTSFAFADLDAGIWGAAWRPQQGSELVMIAAGAETLVAQAALDGGGEQERWQLAGEQLELELAPAGAAVVTEDGFDQLCSVSGSFGLGGATHELASRGWRASEPDCLQTIDSFRRIATWLGEDEGLALLATRPRGAREHESDSVFAAVLDAGREAGVAEPRLSTTYDADARPLRAGLELWLEPLDSEPDDDADDAEHPVVHYPRRAAGEALGRRASWSIAGFELAAELFRWQSHGLDGPGVYLLGARA